MAARYRNGASIRELAADCGRSYGFVNRLLREAGVTLRPQGGVPGRLLTRRRPTLERQSQPGAVSQRRGTARAVRG